MPHLEDVCVCGGGGGEWLITSSITPNQLAALLSKLGGGGGGGEPHPMDWEPVIASPVISKNGNRDTESCFALIGANQCGVLMDVLQCSKLVWGTNR